MRSAVYNSYLSGEEREIAIREAVLDNELHRLEMIYEMKCMQYEQMCLDAEIKVFAEGGTYEDLQLLYLEAEEETNEQKEGILSRIFAAIGNIFRAIADGFKKLFGFKDKIDPNADVKVPNGFGNIIDNVDGPLGELEGAATQFANDGKLEGKNIKGIVGKIGLALGGIAVTMGITTKLEANDWGIFSKLSGLLNNYVQDHQNPPNGEETIKGSLLLKIISKGADISTRITNICTNLDEGLKKHTEQIRNGIGKFGKNAEELGAKWRNGTKTDENLQGDKSATTGQTNASNQQNGQPTEPTENSSATSTPQANQTGSTTQSTDQTKTKETKQKIVKRDAAGKKYRSGLSDDDINDLKRQIKEAKINGNNKKVEELRRELYAESPFIPDYFYYDLFMEDPNEPGWEEKLTGVRKGIEAEKGSAERAKAANQFAQENNLRFVSNDSSAQKTSNQQSGQSGDTVSTTSDQSSDDNTEQEVGIVKSALNHIANLFKSIGSVCKKGVGAIIEAVGKVATKISGGTNDSEGQPTGDQGEPASASAYLSSDYFEDDEVLEHKSRISSIFGVPIEESTEIYNNDYRLLKISKLFAEL